jgi:hypothetical protein
VASTQNINLYQSGFKILFFWDTTWYQGIAKVEMSVRECHPRKKRIFATPLQKLENLQGGFSFMDTAVMSGVEVH